MRPDSWNFGWAARACCPTAARADNAAMRLTRKERIIVGANGVYIPIFTALAWSRGNDEFLLYVAVIIVILGLLVWQQPRLKFDATVLWGLTVWGLMHMAGGNIRVGDGVLYEVILLPLVPSLSILRYDQVVHAFGFGVATLVCFHMLKPYLREGVGKPVALMFLVVMMGSGLGALNEILEFVAVLTMPETNVGGYENTALDLCSNLLGGTIAAVVFLRRAPSAT